MVWDNVENITIRDWLEVQEWNSAGERDFLPPFRPVHPPSLPPRLKKCRVILLLTLWALMACYRVNVL
jgi:hypothetical protein